MTDLGEDSYYFPPGRSMARRVHGERSVGLLYGQRALLIGALEPLTYTGTMLSTRSADRPFERLARTAKIQETVLLGTREEADEALAAVHRLHKRIEGTLPPRVREIFGIRWTRAHEATFRSMTAAHRRGRHLFPRQMRRGRNDVFFDVVTRAERDRGGTPTPELHAGAS